MFPSPATKGVRPLAIGPLGGFGRPGCLLLSPATPSPRGTSPNSSPGVPPYWLVIATSPDGAPDGSPCAPGGSEMRNLAGRTGERRGCRIGEIRWDPLHQPPLSARAGLCWSARARLWFRPDCYRERKAGGSRRPWGCLRLLPLDAAVPHETARCYAGVHLCEGVIWLVFRREAHPLASHTHKGYLRVLLTHMGSGSWNNSPSGFPRLACGLIHYRLGR